MAWAKEVAYTFDAGRNAVLIALDRKAAAQLIQRLLFYFPPKSDMIWTGKWKCSYLLGDKTILKDAGLEGLKNVEALSPPPKNGSAQKYPGDAVTSSVQNLGKALFCFQMKNCVEVSLHAAHDPTNWLFLTQKLDFQVRRAILSLCNFGKTC
ncbi:hypothetical protein GOBAR_DD21773 [Gossypium barbadense]|nr:hypothetical protein GOBAR_DD21773 [Gossypium barbadense]